MDLSCLRCRGTDSWKLPDAQCTRPFPRLIRRVENGIGCWSELHAVNTSGGIWGSLQTCYLLPVGKLLNQDRNQWRRITGTWQCAQPGGSTNPLVIQHHKRTVSMGNVSILIKRARRSRVRPYRIIRTAIWLLLTDRSGIQEFGKGIMRQRNPRKVLVHPTE